MYQYNFELFQKSIGFIFKKILFIYFYRGEEREKGREVSICGCLLCAPYWGPHLQPRHVP